MIIFMTAAAPDAGAAAALDGCITRIAQGSQEALAQLYDRTRPAMPRMCCTMPICRCGTPQETTAPRENPWPG